MNKFSKIILKITGMHCVSCAMNIDFELEDLEGVKTAKTSYAKQECEVEYNPEKTNPQTLILTIKKLGYKVSNFGVEDGT